MAKIVITGSGTYVVGKNDEIEFDIPEGEEGAIITIAADPNEKVDKLRIDFHDDSRADKVIIDLSTFSGEDIKKDLKIDINHYGQNDSVILKGAMNTGVDGKHNENYTFEFEDAQGNIQTGVLHAKDPHNQDFSQNPKPVIICFAEGTLIETDRGPMPVEGLSVGDLVQTQDHGLQPIRWIGRRNLDTLDLARVPTLRPVRVSRGALGGGVPASDLILSPQHRVQIEGWRAQLLLGEDRVLVPIGHLENGRTIRTIRDAPGVTYFHLLFDAHEIITANGALAESLFLGEMAIGALAPAAAAEIGALFPEFASGGSWLIPAARFALRHEAAALTALPA